MTPSLARTLDDVDVTAGSAPEVPSTSGEEGIVYLRRDQDGSEYVGKAKSEGRYEQRQLEHEAANPDAEFEFVELERVPAGSKRPLNVAEEDWIRAGGGPRNKSNPDGELQNKRHEMSEERYRRAGGTIGR